MEGDSIESMIAFIKKIISEEIGEPSGNIDETANFHEFGLDSINSVFIIDQVEAKFNITIAPLHFWDYPTIALLAQQLHKESIS